MNLKDLINKGILDELVTVIQDEANARILLEVIDYPRAGRPTFPTNTNTYNYWMDIGQQIAGGVLPIGNDLQQLVDAAAERYPSNPIFQQYRSQTEQVQQQSEQETGKAHSTPKTQDAPTQRDRSPQYVHILVRGWEDVESLIDSTRNLSNEYGRPPDTIQLGFANAEGVLLSLEGWTVEQAWSLANGLRTNPPTSGQPIEATAAASTFQDYLLSRLYVEGPDQSRFEINDIRASTPIRDVAQGVILEAYDSKAFPGGGRKTVVDRVNPDGSTQRLDPNKSLHESGIKEGETLQVSPESTAGIHPQVREEALARTCTQVLAYAASHPGFEVAANARRTPTEYTFKFQVPSFAPPAIPGSSPIEIDQHEVYLILPPEFPMQAPTAYWQTPIFHPNIDPRFGHVCLGALEESYRPSLDFGELCQILVDIAGYQNYTLEEGYNGAASEWALSKEGQIAIQRRGGKSFYREFIRRKFQDLEDAGVGFDQLQELINPLCEALKDFSNEDLTPDQLRQELEPRPLTVKRVNLA